MATVDDFRRIAMALAGTSEVAHFDRTAFKAVRIYATLAPDGRTANFKFAPDEQELKCTVAPDTFVRVSNAWGRRGWTTATLAALTTAELRDALEMAWRHGIEQRRASRKSPVRRR
jgi:hypothetical protein